MRTLLNMLVKELIQLKRDPRVLSVLFVAPVVQLTLLAEEHAPHRLGEPTVAVRDARILFVGRLFVGQHVDRGPRVAQRLSAFFLGTCKPGQAGQARRQVVAHRHVVGLLLHQDGQHFG